MSLYPQAQLIYLLLNTMNLSTEARARVIDLLLNTMNLQLIDLLFMSCSYFLWAPER
jgi:hypothetical protein